MSLASELRRIAENATVEEYREPDYTLPFVSEFIKVCKGSAKGGRFSCEMEYFEERPGEFGVSMDKYEVFFMKNPLEVGWEHSCAMFEKRYAYDMHLKISNTIQHRLEKEGLKDVSFELRPVECSICYHSRNPWWGKDKYSSTTEYKLIVTVKW